MIDLTKLIMHSAYPNFTFTSSGQFDHDVSGTYTVGASTTRVVATGVDYTKQYAMVFATENRNDATVPYDLTPMFFRHLVNDAGTNKTVYTDIYYYITPSGDLTIRTYNFHSSLTGTFTVVEGDNMRVVWYLMDMPGV